MNPVLEHLNIELFRLSNTPVTPLTLMLLAGVLAVGVGAGPVIRAAAMRMLVGERHEVASIGAGRFGTFAGVFTPSILTILGVIMYLRVGWVTGNVGLGGVMVIVAVSHLITLATGLSLSSIATNRTVGVGGAYFIISRSLGAPVGAAVGIPLFFGQALSVTFYIVGFTESLTMLFPNIPEQTVSTAVLILLALISLKSADLALKIQYVVMAAILLSLGSFFSGWVQPTGIAEAAAKIEWWVGDRASFAEVFAVFFPAVTGIMAGVGMSGDLRDPRRSIPKGTLLAIVVGFVVYMSFPIWLALNADSAQLTDDKMIVWSIARFPALIYAGVWGATLSSAVGSMLTAPRTLQALANDGLVPRVLGRGYGPNNEPRVGVVVTYLLAQAGILIGGLDAIAPVLTMFFLATYGLINLACGLEKWAASPSFRPDFAVPAPVSLIGGIACIYVMGIINTPAMIAAALLCAAIYAFTQRRALNTTYGDARHGIWAALVRSALQRLRRTEFHPLNWRPNLLILGGDYEKRPWLLQLGSIIVQDRGIVTFVELLTGNIAELAPQWRKMRRELDERIQERSPNVFGRVEVVTDKYRGAVSVVQAYGIGHLEANTVMLGWPNKPDNVTAYVRMMRDMVALDRSLLIVNYDARRKLGRYRRIDIWWGGLQGNGGLMLLMAYLITAHHRWRDADVTVRTIVENETQRTTALDNIQGVLKGARVQAEPVVILRNKRSIADIMHSQSKDADLAIAGLRLPGDDDDAAKFFERMSRLLDGMPTTMLVHSARNFESEPVLFDDGAPPAAPSRSGGDERPDREDAAQ
jgi:solute carrier family 12 (sodium/potassium/chloride transporter), member 2